LSNLDEPRIRCPSCGKLAPAMKYCIYCGTRLPQAAPPTVRPPSPALPPRTAPPPTRVTPAPVYTGIKDDIASIMSGITVLYERKVALLDLLQSGQVSERVFLKLYNEYNDKLNDFLNARIRKMEELRSQLDEKNKRLSVVAMNLEELEVRRKVGEIDANVYSQRAENLRAEERELSNSIKTLRTNIIRLEKMLADKKPSEIRDLEMNTRTYQITLKKLVEERKISAETFNAVRSDIEKTLDFFESLIRDRKEKEKNLRERLETLQTRYKLSELSLEEYDRKKRELQAEIDKIWA